MGEFYEKLRKKEKEINELERQIRDQQIKIENEQKEYDDLVLMVDLSFHYDILILHIEK